MPGKHKIAIEELGRLAALKQSQMHDVQVVLHEQTRAHEIGYQIRQLMESIATLQEDERK